MSTSDLRLESGVKDRAAFSKAMDELQAAMIVIPSEVYYQPKFTYIWTLGVGRFPDQLRRRVNRDAALREIARCFLTGAGMTIPGELARVTGLSQAGRRARQPRARRRRVRDDAGGRHVSPRRASNSFNSLSGALRRHASVTRCASSARLTFFRLTRIEP